MFRRPLFSIFFPIYRFCHPVLPSFKQYTCSPALFFQSFFLYTVSAILFYHLLSSIHVPPPSFFNLFSYIQVLPFWAKFSLVWFSLGFDMGLVQNHKRWLTLIQRIPFRSSSQVNVETVQIPLIKSYIQNCHRVLSSLTWYTYSCLLVYWFCPCAWRFAI